MTVHALTIDLEDCHQLLHRRLTGEAGRRQLSSSRSIIYSICRTKRTFVRRSSYAFGGLPADESVETLVAYTRKLTRRQMLR